MNMSSLHSDVDSEVYEMPPPPPQVMTKRERADHQCNQLATRVIGAVSLFIGLLLLIVAMVIFSTPCCGDAFSYDEEKFKRECSSGDTANDIDRTLGGEGNSSEGKSSCFHRNIAVLSCVLFSLLLNGIGITVLVIGECMFTTNEEADDEELEQYARYMKHRNIELGERQKQKRKEEESMARSFSTQDRERTRRNSIGNPSTPSDRQLYASQSRNVYGSSSFNRQGPGSSANVYGNARPYAVV